MRRPFLNGLPAAVSTALLALASAAAPAQPSQNVLRIRLNADIRSMDPGVNRDANTDAVQSHVLEGLVAFKEDTSVGLLLAQSVTVSPDGTVYTFKLRPGITFSNGASLTSADVLSAWDRYMKPATHWRCLGEFDGHGQSKVLKAEARGAATVVFTLEKPSPLFLTTLARTDCGGTGIYHRSSLDAAGQWQSPVGTGPFTLGDWKRGQYVELLPNPRFVSLPGKRDGNTGGKSVDVAKVRFVVIPDPSAAKAAVLSNGVDLNADVAEEDLAEYRSRKDIVVASAPSMDQTGLLLQTRDPLLKDVRIRRALALSLDIPDMVEALTNGGSPASRSAIPRSSPFYGPAQANMPARDLVTARRLLKEAGYDGEPIRLLTTKRYADLFTAAVLAQAMAAEAGIRIDVEVIDWATLLDRYSRGAFQMMSFTYSARLDPSLSYTMFTGSKDAQKRNLWEDKEAVDLVTRSMQTADKAQRQAIFDQLDAKLRNEVPAIWLYSKVNFSAAKTYVKGYEGWPLGQPRAWGVSLLTP